MNRKFYDDFNDMIIDGLKLKVKTTSVDLQCLYEDYAIGISLSQFKNDLARELIDAGYNCTIVDETEEYNAQIRIYNT